MRKRVCKPSSVSPEDPERVIIPLAPTLLPESSDLPGSIERATLKRSSIRSCSGWGLPCQPCRQGCGELLPRLFTLTPVRSASRTSLGAVFFLWHFPWGHPRSPLATTLPYGARTFLPPSASDHPTPFRILKYGVRRFQRFSFSFSLNP